ncbi:hypothetical protein HMI55_007100 [Coelomomyces lativittatus]|nr:hypothetical protein HMI55_007100 [Coelomomyces lativittatus]
MERSVTVSAAQQRQVENLEQIVHTLQIQNTDVLMRRDRCYDTIASHTHLRNLLDTLPRLTVEGRTTVLSPLGGDFYAECDLVDLNTIFLNLGCGVVVPMTPKEVLVYLDRKDKLLKAQVDQLTRSSIQLRYRRRLVLEALSRCLPGSQ